MPTESAPPSIDSMSRGERWRSLVAVIGSATMAGVTFGLVIPLLALILEHDGVEPTWIGLNAAIASVAVLVIGPFVPRILGTFGVLPTMVVAVVASVALVLLLPVFTGLGAWFVIRFLIGMFGAVHWIVSETWVVALTRPANRGTIIALYLTMLAAGIAMGPLVINLVGVEGWLPFIVTAAIFASSGLPLLLARNCAPVIPPRVPAAFSNAFRIAPFVMGAGLISGFTDTGLLSLLPVYGLRLGLDQELAVDLLFVLLIGNLFLQVPIGWLSDRLAANRRHMLLAFGAIMIVSPLLLPLVIDTSSLRWTLLFLWGGASFGLYTVGLSLLGDRVQPGAFAGANAAFVAAFELGSVGGPSFGGAAMDAFGASGFMHLLALTAAGYCLFGLLRRPDPA